MGGVGGRREAGAVPSRGGRARPQVVDPGEELGAADDVVAGRRGRVGRDHLDVGRHQEALPAPRDADGDAVGAGEQDRQPGVEAQRQRGTVGVGEVEQARGGDVDHCLAGHGGGGRNGRELDCREPSRVAPGVERRRLPGDHHLRPIAGRLHDRDPVAVEDLGHQPVDEPPAVVVGHPRQPGGDVDRIGQGWRVERTGLVRLGPQAGDGHVDPGVVPGLDGSRLGGVQGARGDGGVGSALVTLAVAPAAGAHESQEHGHDDESDRRPPPPPRREATCGKRSAADARLSGRMAREGPLGEGRPFHATPITITGARAGSSQRRTSSRRSTGSETHPPVGRPVETCRKMAEPRPGVRSVL